MKFEKNMIKLLVTKTELDRLNKWADTCYGEQVQTMLKLPDKRWEVIYRFNDTTFRQNFIDELTPLFGSAVEVINH